MLEISRKLIVLRTLQERFRTVLSFLSEKFENARGYIQSALGPKNKNERGLAKREEKEREERRTPARAVMTMCSNISLQVRHGYEMGDTLRSGNVLESFSES